MKFLYVTLLFLNMFHQAALASTEEEKVTQQALMQVQIDRIKNVSGQLHYQLFACPNDDKHGWNELTLLSQGQVAITDNTVDLPLAAVASSEVIFRAYQDLNNNGQLDYASNGVPKEPTAFANNPNLMLGMPKPLDACVNWQNNRTVKVKMNNKRQRRKRG